MWLTSFELVKSFLGVQVPHIIYISPRKLKSSFKEPKLQQQHTQLRHRHAQAKNRRRAIPFHLCIAVSLLSNSETSHDWILNLKCSEENENYPFCFSGSSLPSGLVWAASTVDQDDNFMILGGYLSASARSDTIYIYKHDEDQWVKSNTTLSREIGGQVAIKVKYSIFACWT